MMESMSGSDGHCISFGVMVSLVMISTMTLSAQWVEVEVGGGARGRCLRS